MAARKPRQPVKGATPDARWRRYGDQALERLAWLMENAESEAAQVAAAKELLDRVAGRCAPAAGDASRPGLDEVVARLRQLRARPRNG